MVRDPHRKPSLEALHLKVGEEELVVLAMADEPAPQLDLTRAESEVAQLVREGLSNAEIAGRRGTSVRTVANQIASVFAKLGVGSRVELVARLAGGR